MAVDYALAESLVPITDDIDFNNVMIGNSRFTDDIWDLRPFITKKTTVEAHKYLRFEYVKNDDMKFTVKQYAYYKLGVTKPQTVLGYINGNGTLNDFNFKRESLSDYAQTRHTRRIWGFLARILFTAAERVI